MNEEADDDSLKSSSCCNSKEDFRFKAIHLASERQQQRNEERGEGKLNLMVL